MLAEFLFLFSSFLVNFTNLSWKQLNIILIYILNRTVLLLACFFLNSCFLFCLCLVPGGGGWGGGGGGVH